MHLNTSLCVSLIILMRHQDYKNIKEFPHTNIPLAHVLRNVTRTVWKICSLMIRLKGITEMVIGTLGKEECFFFYSIFSTL